MELLRGWYPGLGEVEIIRRMSPLIQGFLVDATRECPEFLSEYLLPVLDEYQCPEDKIAYDLSNAIYAVDCQELGLAGWDDFDQVALGELGGVLKKIKKAVKKVAHKVIAPVKKVIEKITPKPVLNIMKKGAAAITKVHKAGERVAEKVEHAAGQVGKKYGNVIITAAGAILAPFTGGASLAAAALLTTANTMYQKKRAAARAKQLSTADAKKVEAEAATAEAETLAQVNAFYSQNQQWFIDNGITPEMWAGMTLQQKIDAINRGATGQGSSGGSYTPPTSFPGQSTGQPSGYTSGGGAAASGGGYGASGGGGGGGGYSPGGGDQAGQPGVQQAGMFGGASLPLLAAGVALAFVFGKPAKGGRARRNPRKRSRRAVA